MSAIAITASSETWPVAGAFTISRGSRTEQTVVVVQASADGHVGRGECVPYARYGETVEQVLAAITSVRDVSSREALAAALPPGAARNGIDCALWDLECKRSGKRAWDLAGLPPPSVPSLTEDSAGLANQSYSADERERIFRGERG